MAVRSDDEIYSQIDKCRAADGSPTNRWPGMTYEQGVQEALMWVVGDSEDEPIESGSDEDA